MEKGVGRMQPIDEASRQQARTAAVNVLVEAGAGTGKTTLLIDRVMDGLVNRHIPLSRMLLITFMEKAQQEMRERLRAKLEGLKDAASAPEPIATEALRDLPSAAITTIHGFCHRVLAEFGADYGIPAGFQVLDEIEADRLWEQSFGEWVQDPQYTEPILALLNAGITFTQLKKWARDISRWSAIPDVEGAFPNLERFVEHFGAEAERYHERATADAVPGDAGRAQIAAVVREFQWLRRVGRSEWPRMLAQWTAGLAPKGNKKNWSHSAWLQEQKEWMQTLRETLALLRQQMADAYLSQWVGLVREGFQPYWRRSRFTALALTFDDLLIEAERITRAPAVRSTLRARFDLVMVDEFQDTDPVQSAVIRRLVTPIDSHQLDARDQGRLFLVGDPKQSIYRFRGADVETYAGVRNELERSGGAVIPIWQNFRSNPAILDFVNQWFSGRWPESPDPDRPYIPPFQPLYEAFPRDERRRVAVVQLGFGQPAIQKRREEAGHIAEVVAQAIREEWPVRDGSGTRPIRHGDIALVVPQRTEIEIYRQALVERGIPVASQGGRGFFKLDEIRGLAHLFRALDNPDDSVALIGWLLSPWVALTHRTLAQHRQQGGMWDYREDSVGHPRVVEWWRRLKGWHERFWRVDAETVVDWAMASSPLAVVLRERGDDAALANLAQMRALARELGDRWGIFEFTQWFSTQVHDGAPYEEAPILRNESEVAVSTVHQAKGLEWPMVIVANWKPKDTHLESGIRYNPRLRTAALRQEPWESQGWEALEADHRLREEAEGDRLLYVALTRAKDYLWFYASFLDPLKEASGESKTPPSPEEC